jgi:cytosolic nonspecific dipeptidase
MATAAEEPTVIKVEPSAEELEFYKFIEAREEIYVERLREAVAIASVSAWPDKRDEITKMMEWTRDWIVKLGGTASLKPNPVPFEEEDGHKIPNPPILLGAFGNDPNKRTVCVYGHLDVQPARMSDGWDTEPFTLTDVNGALYGRGASDDKGPALSWLWVVEALQELGRELPVNIKIIYEGLEEFGSAGMQEAIQEEVGGASIIIVIFIIIIISYISRVASHCITQLVIKS